MMRFDQCVRLYFSPSRCNSIEEDTLMRRANEAEPVESDKVLQNYKK